MIQDVSYWGGSISNEDGTRVEEVRTLAMDGFEEGERKARIMDVTYLVDGFYDSEGKINAQIEKGGRVNTYASNGKSS